MRVAEPITMDAQTERELLALSKGRRVEARVQQRATVILLAAQGWQNKDIAEQVKLDRRQVALWRRRFIEGGVQALLQDAPRSGRASSVSSAVEWYILRATLEEQPASGSSWSARSLAAHLDLSATTVRRVWQRHGIVPNAPDTPNLSHAGHAANAQGIAKPRELSSSACLDQRLIEVVGLYMNLPERALVLSCGEHGAELRAQAGRSEGEVRAQMARLVAALKLMDRPVKPALPEAQRHEPWLRFLQGVQRRTPEHLQLHLIVEGPATYQHPAVQAWLAGHPRVFVHFPLAGASWLKRVQRNLNDFCEHGIHRHSFTRLPQVLQAIARHIDAHPRQRPPFSWTASAGPLAAAPHASSPT